MAIESDLMARLREPPYSSSPISERMAKEVEDLEQEQLSVLEEQLHQLNIHDHSSPTAETLPHQETACSRILAIPELSILILGFLSPLSLEFTEAEDPRSRLTQSRSRSLWTLLHAQRVNQTWRALIKNVQLLQQCLFLTPCTTSLASWTATSPSSCRPFLNPLIQTITHWRYSHLEMGGKYSAHMIIERNDYEHLTSLPPTQKYMLLSQPPVTDITAMIWERETLPESGQARVRPPSSFYSVKHVRDDGGIVFGKVLEMVGQMLDDDATLKAIKICTA